ncbi:response regulator [Desulfoluna spongiiphila]|uniref:response regulator n=1 Tax=Desulfoluna spongiiphila TaxID=419481 RepID=UPI001259EEB1|nr:response regulator [Desulfoluna spongiiphila]VVS92202.1 signal transduction response regulator receiver domain [Desulfoluna spongiiphila]
MGMAALFLNLVFFEAEAVWGSILKDRKMIAKNHKILVVDDNRVNLMLLSKILEREGYQVEACPNVKDAMGFAIDELPDLIISDICMPDETGFDFLKQLQDNSETSSIPVVFVTAMIDIDSKIEAFNLGVFDYITKPFHTAEIIVRVRNIFRILKHVEIPIEAASMKQNIFVSYSHEDKIWLERLKVHLRPYERQSKIYVWDDTRIASGEDWKNEIEKALKKSKIAVLLISANFLASDFIANNELPPLLDNAEADGTVVIPVIVKPCSFEAFEELSRFQAVNPPSKTLIEMNEGEQERTMYQVSREIIKYVEKSS